MKADARTEADVQAALKRMMDAYASRDLSGVLDCFASDADVVLIGTGADEKCVGPEQIRRQVERDWTQSESAAMAFSWTSISAAGATAWAAVDGSFRFRAGGQEGALPARGTFVLEKRDGKWLIVHMHVSTPNAAQQAGKSF